MTRNTRDDIGKESSSHITKNISVTGIDKALALAHAIFTSDVDIFPWISSVSLVNLFILSVLLTSSKDHGYDYLLSFLMIIELLEEATSTERFTSLVLIIILSCKTTSKCTKLSLMKELIKERFFASYHLPLIFSFQVSLFLRH